MAVHTCSLDRAGDPATTLGEATGHWWGHLRHELRARRKKKGGVAYDKLPDVNELRQRMALFDNDFLRPLDPRRVLMVARGKPLR